MSNIRWMIRRDFPEVLEIDKLSFPKEWNEEKYLEALRARNVIGMISEVGETINGLLVYELFKEKLTISRLAVHPDYRNKGVGTALIEKLISKLESHRRYYMDIKVSQYNLNAQLFLKHRKFLAVKCTKNNYVMEYSVGKAPFIECSHEPINRISKFEEGVCNG